MKFLGVDTGGTFTDLILSYAGSILLHKVLSTPEQPEKAILQGMRELGIAPEDTVLLTHGSTVATNAVLQRKGAKTAYISCRGFGDILTLGRQARPKLYQRAPQPIPPPVPPELCLETGGRITHLGEVLDTLTENDLVQLQQQIKELKPESIAINLLFSFVDKQYEQRIAAALGDEYFISCSSELLAESREYERGIVTWLNSYSGPLMQSYLERLQQALAHTTTRVMQSHGQTIAASKAAQKSVYLLLSGPSGGVIAVHQLAKLCGFSKTLSFDMGGTSTDVSMLNGKIPLTNSGSIGGFPVATPMIDIHTIGSGGGSIAYCDAGGLLRVGPHSAGADPGPACYGSGGELPTVTDANLLLGYLPDTIGHMKLKHALAQRAFTPLAQQLHLSVEETAAGVIKIVNEQMANALRLIATQGGQDPGEYVLVGFGAAGGLHICNLAENLRIRHAMIPACSGILSALGMLTAEQGLYQSQTLGIKLCDANTADMNKVFTQLLQQATQAMQEQKLSIDKIQQTIAMRYHGQWHSLMFPFQDLAELEKQFHTQHEKLYGFRLHAPIELVTARTQTTANAKVDMCEVLKALAASNTPDQIPVPTPGRNNTIHLIHRYSISDTAVAGPALIVENTSTMYLAQGWEAYSDELGNLHLEMRNTSL